MRQEREEPRVHGCFSSLLSKQQRLNTCFVSLYIFIVVFKIVVFWAQHMTVVILFYLHYCTLYCTLGLDLLGVTFIF